MAKGDYVQVKSEIGGKLETDFVTVKGSGGTVEVDWSDRSKGFVAVKLKGRTGKVKQAFTYALSAVRSLEVVNSDDD